MKRAAYLFIMGITICGSIGFTASFQGLGDLPGNSFSSVATDVSGDGTIVVGYSESASGSSQVFRWTASEGMVGLAGLVGSFPMGSHPEISRDGSTIVGSIANEAVRWTAANGIEPLGVLGGTISHFSKGMGVSNDGSIAVGYSSSSSLAREEAFKWTRESGMVSMFSSNPLYSRAFAISDDGSVIVGNAQHPAQGGLVACQWTESGMTYLLDPSGLFHAAGAADVSADGSVIVGYGMGDNSWEAYRWTDETGLVPLGYIQENGYNSYAWGVSADGTRIVGECGVGQVSEAFLWDELNGMRSIKEILVNDLGLDLSGWSLTNAQAVSSDGMTIVGVGRNPDGYLEGWIATIPEPGTMGLVAVGAVMLRKKAKGKR